VTDVSAAAYHSPFVATASRAAIVSFSLSLSRARRENKTAGEETRDVFQIF